MTTIESLIAVGNKIIQVKSKINSIQDSILYCSAYEKITPIQDCAKKYKERGQRLKDSLPKQERQLFIFEMGYNNLLNKY